MSVEYIAKPRLTFTLVYSFRSDLLKGVHKLLRLSSEPFRLQTLVVATWLFALTSTSMHIHNMTAGRNHITATQQIMANVNTEGKESQMKPGG